MLANLSQKLQAVMAKLKNRGRLSPADVKAALREVKLALLEADVNYKVVREFIATLEQRCVGEEILSSLTPGQQVIKIVRDELTRLLGQTGADLKEDGKLSVYLLVGLQGMGKTTSTVKLARYLQAKGKRPLTVSLDTKRPGAIKQLAVAAEQAGVDCYQPTGDDAVKLAAAAVKYAAREHNVLLLDTAGRMHIDAQLMDELDQIKQTANPTEIILVLDAMTGQDAVNVAQNFASRDLADSVVLTKLDSDARGGAALSVRAVTGRPIKFVGTGEKTDKLEKFHPDRLASQILGLGDVLTLIEKAEAAFDKEQAAKLQQKLLQDQFTLEDFRDQLRQFRNMGSLDQIAGMLPGGAKLGSLQVDEKELSRYDAIISSMTPAERAKPNIINGSRRKRIARGSGTSVQVVNKLLKQFAAMQKMFRQLNPSKAKKGKFPFPFKI